MKRTQQPRRKRPPQDSASWRVVVWSAAICGLAMGLSAAPVAAQPQADGAEMSAEVAQIKREWGELQRAVGTEEVTAPAGAITRYQAFFEARGFRSGTVSVEIASRIAQLHWRGLGDRAKASEVLQWAIKQYAGQPQVERLQRELALVKGEGNATETPDLPDTPQATQVAPVAAPVVPSVALPFAPTVALPVAPSLTLPGAPIATLGGAMPGKVPVPQMAGGAPQLVKSVGGIGAVALTSLARRLNTGNLSQSQVEAAWQASGVSAAEVLDWLQTSARFDRDVQGALVPLMGLVVQHAPQLASAPQEWNEREQLLLAKFYTTQKDERAEPIYLRLLDQLKTEPLQMREVPAVYGLHSYYLALGQTERAADTLLSASQYSIKPSVVGNTPVEAARLYREVGQDEKAKAAYAKAQKSEFGWSVGLALYDQASALMGQGRYEEARELLKQPVKGQFADQIQIGMLALLSDSYFRSGESEAASRYGEECLARYKALSNPLEGEGIQPLVIATKQRLLTIAQGGVYYDERIIKRGENQLTEDAVYDEAYALMKADKHKEARALLQQSVTGADAAVRQVSLLSLLSASYLKTGEVELAQSTARKALETYRGLKNPQSNQGLEYQVERAKKVLDWSGRYRAGQRSINTVTPVKAVAP